MEQRRQFQILALPSRGAILLTVTSKGWQNTLQKSRTVYRGTVDRYIAIVLECSYISFWN